jgi:hypothetical protein
LSQSQAIKFLLAVDVSSGKMTWLFVNLLCRQDYLSDEKDDAAPQLEA